MGLYDKNGDLNDNHWVLKAARWAGVGQVHITN